MRSRSVCSNPRTPLSTTGLYVDVCVFVREGGEGGMGMETGTVDEGEGWGWGV